MTEAVLVLADGTAFRGHAFGAATTTFGEAVFNTSMTGYPELLTDPSYRKQILTLTVAEVGNYGVCERDAESDGVHVSGLVVRSLSPIVSNWRSDLSLDAYLHKHGVPGIAGIDTRALVRRLRDSGTMMAALSTDGTAINVLREKTRVLPGMAGQELISEVTSKSVRNFTGPVVDDAGQPMSLPPPELHVVCVDFGIKSNMARMLLQRGCRVTIVPARTSARDIAALKPDGVLLSNGPGDPSTVPDVVGHVRTLLGTVPIFGICMGHQVLGQALGARTFKTRFGHRGANQSVRLEVASGAYPKGRVLVTSQNHGFCVTESELQGASASETNLSDGTNEGIDAHALWAFSVQYHPEAAPGPHDAALHFDRFVAMMRAFVGTSDIARSTGTSTSSVRSHA